MDDQKPVDPKPLSQRNFTHGRGKLAEHPDPLTQREERAARLARLPAWAQAEIKALTRARDEAKAEVRALVEGQPESDTSLVRPLAVGRDEPGEFFLPDGAVIRFYLDPEPPKGKAGRQRKCIEVNVSRDPHRPPALFVSSSTGQVAVYPRASNSLSLMEVDRAAP